MIDYKAHAEFLYGLLDDIDTASDMAKSDDTLYRSLIEKYHRRRFEVAESDGYQVYFKSADEKSAIPISNAATHEPASDNRQDSRTHDGPCTYSRAINQPYPRLCVICGKPEVK